ncbi:hypothetical protein [Stutzerimonas stutzeri]|uniref:hypothetical protein n=1 Tax=Stutzerimonas stutzeri TaxID=316 RepID=UPI000371BCFF|nr:hypothetical protein [Stutzerimonas stutzeri]
MTVLQQFPDGTTRTGAETGAMVRDTAALVITAAAQGHRLGAAGGLGYDQAP